MLNKIILAAGCLLAAGCGPQGGDGNNMAADGGSAAAPAAKKAPAQGERPILDSLTRSREHGTLANAVKAAGLTETLSGPTPYTLFAPTNAAFEKLAPGALNGLLAPDAKGQLVALLTGHIVPGVVTAEDLGRAIDRGKGEAKLATVGGNTLIFTRSGDRIVVASGESRAQLERADMLQSNGVIHSLDEVLMSPG